MRRWLEPSTALVWCRFIAEVTERSMPSLSEVEQAFWARVWRCAHHWPCKRCCWPWQPATMKGSKWHPSSVPTWARNPPYRTAVILTAGALLLPAPPHTFVICHRCDWPPCCNPAHLWVGTSRDNRQDARDKGWFRAQRRRRYVVLPDGSKRYVFDGLPQQLRPQWGAYLRACRQRDFARIDALLDLLQKDPSDGA